jgi:hypothetical protein
MENIKIKFVLYFLNKYPLNVIKKPEIKKFKNSPTPKLELKKTCIIFLINIENKPYRGMFILKNKTGKSLKSNFKKFGKIGILNSKNIIKNDNEDITPITEIFFDKIPLQIKKSHSLFK